MEHATVNLSRGGRDVSRMLMKHLNTKKIHLNQYTLDPIEIIDSIKVRTTCNASNRMWNINLNGQINFPILCFGRDSNEIPTWWIYNVFWYLCLSKHIISWVHNLRKSSSKWIWHLTQTQKWRITSTNQIAVIIRLKLSLKKTIVGSSCQTRL